ncbi:hypothetical protein ACJMK2_020027 [Sinanodonta woodiana]|uniref:FBXO47 ARM repeats region domain-containing protein n=1 Tax=Sinanodonta woodiana TaxID=1069815 RepID=A0ABD3TYU6_SINWO
MDLKAYLPCKKPRRSNRLGVKGKEETQEETIQQEPLGFFDTLPLELKFRVLGYLTVEDLSLLTITSKGMRNLVEGFCVLHPVLQKGYICRLHSYKGTQPVLPIKSETEALNTFRKLGLLMKRSTCLYATRDRLKFLNDVLTKMMCCNSIHLCDNSSRCIAMKCFGKLMHTVLAGWDDSECQRAYDAICQHTCILKTLKNIVGSKPGTNVKLEHKERLFLRRVFLDSCPSLQDRSFWLSRILKSWPLVHQARLLFLLYGPVLNDEVLWYELCENTPSSSTQSEEHFGELANALKNLHSYKQEWTEDDIISVIDELTSSPDDWLAENVAHLLILCGDSVTSKMLISKAINGRMIELASITTSFCVVCVKNSFSMSYVINMIQNIILVMDTVKDRQIFFNNVMDMFKELIIDIHEFEDQDDEHGTDMYYMVSSLVEFTKRLAQMAFKDMLT